MRSLAALAMLILPSAANAACAVEARSASDFRRAQIVVEASPIRELRGAGPPAYQVQVLATLKGSAPAILTVRAPDDSGRSALFPGQRYLLFIGPGGPDDHGPGGILRVESCSGGWGVSLEGGRGVRRSPFDDPP